MPDSAIAEILRASVLTSDERDHFDRSGYLVVPNALPPALIERLRDAVDRVAASASSSVSAPSASTASPASPDLAPTTPPARNLADILGRDDAFLELLDCPRVFPKLWGLLGWNIWVQHSHLVVTPPAPPPPSPRPPSRSPSPDSPSSPSPSAPFVYGWHRDGGALNRDVQLSSPLLIKVGFYLTDVDLHGGPTLMLDGADLDAPIPAPTAPPPPSAHPLTVRAGTAVLFGNRSIHSLRSPNTSPHTRRAVFLQYGYRWIHSLDRSTVDHLASRVTPIRAQLLGLTTTFTTAAYKGSEGRSGRFVPSAADVPLFSFIKHLLGPNAQHYVARSLDDSELRQPTY